MPPPVPPISRSQSSLHSNDGNFYLRAKVNDFISSSKVEVFMTVVILLNVCLIVVETDSNAECVTEGLEPSNCQKTWILALNIALLITYTIESLLRLFADRLYFFFSFWNDVDALVVVLCWADMGLVLGNTSFPGPSAAMLRMFRIARLARILRLISIFPELYELIRGFFAAAMAMFWGFIMIICFILIFSIIGVEVVHPMNVSIDHDSDYCKDAFSSVWSATLLFIQTLVAGDSWGACTVPIIQYSKLTFTFFVCAVVSVQLGMTNLILAVVVARADAARQADVQQCLKEKDKSQKRAAEQMRQDLSSIDDNANGTISVEELREGFDTNASLRGTLMSLDIKSSDLEDFFALLDTSNNGELEYDRLVDALVSTLEGDVRKHIMMVRLQISQIGQILNQNRLEVDQIRKSVESNMDQMLNDNRLLFENICTSIPPALISEPHKSVGQKPAMSEPTPQHPSRNEAMSKYIPQAKHPVGQDLLDKVKKLSTNEEMLQRSNCDKLVNM